MTRPTLYPTGPLVQRTIGIPAALWAEMEAEARARKVSTGTVARERLEAGRGMVVPTPAVDIAPLPPDP